LIDFETLGGELSLHSSIPRGELGTMGALQSSQCLPFLKVTNDKLKMDGSQGEIKTLSVHFMQEKRWNSLQCAVEWKDPPLVAKVVRNGAAERRGIREGDRILELNGTETDGKSRAELLPLLGQRPLTIKVERTVTNVEKEADTSGKPMSPAVPAEFDEDPQEYPEEWISLAKTSANKQGRGMLKEFEVSRLGSKEGPKVPLLNFSKITATIDLESNGSDSDTTADSKAEDGNKNESSTGEQHDATDAPQHNPQWAGPMYKGWGHNLSPSKERNIPSIDRL
jgi:membrane-associated protease RseP (regulator of RpoE activity)